MRKGDAHCTCYCAFGNKRKPQNQNHLRHMCSDALIHSHGPGMQCRPSYGHRHAAQSGSKTESFCFNRIPHDCLLEHGALLSYSLGRITQRIRRKEIDHGSQPADNKKLISIRQAACSCFYRIPIACFLREYFFCFPLY